MMFAAGKKDGINFAKLCIFTGFFLCSNGDNNKTIETAIELEENHYKLNLGQSSNTWDFRNKIFLLTIPFMTYVVFILQTEILKI